MYEVGRNEVESQALLWPKSNGWRLIIKRLFDICAAIMLLIIFMPTMIFVAFGVRLSSPGPMIFAQYRIGRGGRQFKFYKFRSMHVDAEEKLKEFLASNPSASAQWAEYRKLTNDPRITRFGRFIRRTSLDELPQLWNVLTGDMSLVGPRPVTASEKEKYGEFWASYCAVRPGLTGLWQVSGRSKLTYSDRVALDHRYVNDLSLVSDGKILLRTVAVVLRQDGSM